MDTKILKINPNDIDFNLISAAANILKVGGIVAFPTETVYGLGANALDPVAVAKIFNAKGRPADNPLIVHISRFEQLNDIVSEISEGARLIAESLWPGPITIIFKKKPIVPNIVSANLDTVAVRMPSHAIAFELIDKSGLPIAAPSANLSGKPSPTLGKHVIEDLMGKADAIIDGGGCDFGIESTVVDLSEDKPLILRPGAVTLEDLREFLPEIEYANGMLDKLSKDEKPKAPGMKYRHYAPNATVFAFEGEFQVVREDIQKRLSTDKENGIKSGVLGKNGDYYEDYSFNIDYTDGVQGLAKILFGAFREFDEKGIKRVYCEPIIGGGVAIAVKNRLYKAAGYNIIRV